MLKAVSSSPAASGKVKSEGRVTGCQEVSLLVRHLHMAKHCKQNAVLVHIRNICHYQCAIIAFMVSLAQYQDLEECSSVGDWLLCGYPISMTHTWGVVCQRYVYNCSLPLLRVPCMCRNRPNYTTQSNRQCLFLVCLSFSLVKVDLNNRQLTSKQPHHSHKLLK